MSPLLLAAIAAAAEPAPPGPLHHGADLPLRVRYGGERWDTWGELRVRFDTASSPPLDEDGFTAPRPWWLATRLIYGADWRPTPNVAVVLEAEEFSGVIAAPPSDLGQAVDDRPFRVARTPNRDLIWSTPRNVYVAATAPGIGQVRVGAQSFSWGAGMLANDGRADQDFGEPDQGNVNWRLLLATRPLAGSNNAIARGLSVFVAGDLVLRDDNAMLLHGDRAWQGVLGVVTRSERLDLGVLASARFQRDRAERTRPDDARATTTAFPVDVHARALLTRTHSPYRFTLEAEGAVITGRTTRPFFEATVPDGARLLAGGALARLRFDADGERLTVKAEVGVASGDDDPRDDVVRSFSFHSDHEVGLILFEHLLPALTARSADRTADPALLAVPAPGARYTIQQGAVTNAVYLNPVVRWRPLERLDLRAGWLAAWSAGRMWDLYATALNGGYPASWGGAPADARALGHEADLSARYRYAPLGNFAVTVGVEGAVFVAGRALAPLDLPTQGTVRALLDVTW